MRRARPLSTYYVNGWLIEKLPNTFAERYVYQAVALTSDGYQTARHGFQTKRAAMAFAAMAIAPATRET